MLVSFSSISLCKVVLTHPKTFSYFKASLNSKLCSGSMESSWDSSGSLTWLMALHWDNVKFAWLPAQGSPRPSPCCPLCAALLVSEGLNTTEQWNTHLFFGCSPWGFSSLFLFLRCFPSQLRGDESMRFNYIIFVKNCCHNRADQVQLKQKCLKKALGHYMRH